jgi:hypothetical protein
MVNGPACTGVCVQWRILGRWIFFQSKRLLITMKSRCIFCKLYNWISRLYFANLPLYHLARRPRTCWFWFSDGITKGHLGCLFNLHCSSRLALRLSGASAIRPLLFRRYQVGVSIDPGNFYRETITWLMSEGYIFETHDSDHARIVTTTV